jgi:UDP-N-acetylglucosamine 2-epimerase (non-hydrolysing)
LLLKPVLVVVGTRPEIIKMAPIVRALKKHDVPFLLVHCGQHYDYNMSQKFIEDLELPAPNYSFKIRSSSAGEQFARIMLKMDKVLKETLPSVVLVEGDTNTVLAAALAANKRGLRVGHVEAGLRSFDLRMPEEHNRRLTDHVSEFLFAPTLRSEENLKRECVWGKIFVTGNTVIDAVAEHLPIAERKSTIPSQIKFHKFALATAHRAENVDDLNVLKNFMGVLENSPLPVVYSMHPRTRKRLRQNKLLTKILKCENVQVFPPLGYLDFLVLMRRCKLIITDSGGIQEEATAPQIRKPVLVMRLSTERPEAVEAGFAQVVGTDKNKALPAINQALTQQQELPKTSPYGNGDAAEKTLKIIQKEILT